MNVFVVASLGVLAALQLIAAARVALRLARQPVLAPLRPGTIAPDGSLSILLPVLDEATRLAAALRAISACGVDCAEIIVVDGGSTDATMRLAGAFAARDRRIRLIDAGPPPPGWNGKMHNLRIGLDEAAGDVVLCLDADVVIDPALPSALRAAAAASGAALVSVAARQRTRGMPAAALHAAFLATLVYRNGRPGSLSRRPGEICANGQIFLASTAALRRSSAFAVARASRCDDLTAAHAIAADGGSVAFVEAPDLARTAMYDGLRDTARNWPRSLSLRDAATAWIAPRRLADLIATLVLPPLILLAAEFVAPSKALAVLRMFELALIAMRIGVLVGTARAYIRPRLGFVLSICCDIPAVLLILAALCSRRVRWRGRALVEEKGRACIVSP